SWFKTEQEGISQLNEYKTYNKNREIKDCGGIMVLIKNDIPCSVIQVDTLDLEIIWLAVRPVWLPRHIGVIIMAAVYFPPKTPAATRDQLIDHIVSTAQLLQTKYTNPGFVILGDFNTFPVAQVTRPLRLIQVVKIPTRGQNTLDKILTNIHKLYKAPISLPALGSSDHVSVLWEPIHHQQQPNQPKTQYSRRFPDSKIREFGMWITQQTWQEVLDAEGTNNKCDLFYDIIWEKINDCFPLKKRRTHPNDKPWMNTKIKGLIAERQKAHQGGNNELKKQLAKKITYEIKQAKRDYHATQMERIRTAEPRCWFNHIKRILGTKQKDSLDNISELTSNPDKCANTINNHFASINTTLPPLRHEELPAYLPARPTPINVSEHQVYRLLNSIPATKAPGPGDIPPRLLKEFGPELAKPFCDIFNSSLQEGVFPRRWKKAFAVPVPKTPTPNTLDDIRPVSLTPNPSKTLERIVAEEVWKTITPQLDPRQYGNVKGSSCLHYLVDYIDFVSSNVDNNNEVAAVTIDLSKAFDLIDHNIPIRKLLDLKIHESLVKWIASFISDRFVATRARGQVSSDLPLHCGVPQGTVLGPLLFIIMVNENWDPASRIYKYVDDSTIAVAYKPGDTPPIQEILHRVSEWTKANNMKINPKKCAVLNYKFNKKPVSLPPVSIEGKQLCVVNNVSLLGAKLSDD
ncbi:MAG: reverse transcriptase family protein, partial [Cyanobacteria bacterium J06553_1]